jgi:hypothetical protein
MYLMFFKFYLWIYSGFGLYYLNVTPNKSIAFKRIDTILSSIIFLTIKITALINSF